MPARNHQILLSKYLLSRSEYCMQFSLACLISPRSTLILHRHFSFFLYSKEILEFNVPQNRTSYNSSILRHGHSKWLVRLVITEFLCKRYFIAYLSLDRNRLMGRFLQSFFSTWKSLSVLRNSLHRSPCLFCCKQLSVCDDFRRARAVCFTQSGWQYPTSTDTPSVTSTPKRR